MYGSVRSQEQAMRYLLGHGMTSIEVGERLHVNPSTVRDWKRFYLMFGCTPAVARKRRKKGKHRLYNRKFSPGMKIRLMEIVRTRPHIYLHEIQQRFGETTGVYSSHSAIWKVLHELRWSLQQAQFAAAQRDEVARAEHLATLRDVTDDPKQFVFVDETSKDPDDVLRRRAWQPVNNPQHLSRYFTDGSIYSYTMIAAADIEGYVAEACELVRRKRGPDDADEDAGTIDAERFVHWVEYSLVPTLGNYLRGEPRSIVVMDNASIHMDVRVHELIAGAGALLIYQSAYSPDFNPIELTFHQYKSHLRQNYDQFAGDHHAAHWAAMATVTGANMRAYYRRIAAIRNVPPEELDPEGEDRSRRRRVLLVLACAAAVLAILKR